MNNIMLMADTYADRFYHNRRHHDQSTEYDRAASRAALEAAVTVLEKDAKRYQWMREGNFTGQWLLREVSGGWKEGMDKAIDNAMESK